MVDARSRPATTGEEGTTLVELLVVMTLLAVVGTITTVGVVSGFRAQLSAVNVSETLDGTRIAAQRVRDFVRAATEVCANSTKESLVLWTDDDDDGVVADGELDIFEVVVDASGDEVFQRRVPSVSGDTIQLIRDDIINDAVFGYDPLPQDQPDDLICTGPVTTTNGPSAIRVVTVQFTVENPDPAEPPLTTETQVRLRNAELVEGPENEKPVAAFTFDCPDADRRCDFDASDSFDPDGGITSYDWTFTDPVTDTVVGTASGGILTDYLFPQGDKDYEAKLVVTDDNAGVDDVVQIVRPVEIGTNVPPTADFSFACTGLQCDFFALAPQASPGSADTDGTITSFAWDFGDGDTGTGPDPSHTYASNGTYPVTLTVTDDDGATATASGSVTASLNAIYVQSLTAVKKASGNKLEYTVTLVRSVGGSPGAGLVVTLDIDPADQGVLQGSCTTGSSGSCSFEVSLSKSASYPVVAEVASVTNTGTFVYDEDQNVDDTETTS